MLAKSKIVCAVSNKTKTNLVSLKTLANYLSLNVKELVYLLLISMEKKSGVLLSDRRVSQFSFLGELTFLKSSSTNSLYVLFIKESAEQKTIKKQMKCLQTHSLGALQCVLWVCDMGEMVFTLSSLMYWSQLSAWYWSTCFV